MNINSGGPHLLLFERDQQLAALLMSELQLAGYECHTARTAVEVFDAIARYPIRLVLVNLAQAAAGRREFWVALDAQRRGRGVQVFTFRCMNLASYGPDDPDDHSRTVLPDMEVDGMLGVVNLVNALRARLPVTTTGSFARATSFVTNNPDTNKQRPQQTSDRPQGDLSALNRQVQIEEEPMATPPVMTQSAAPPLRTDGTAVPASSTRQPPTPQTASTGSSGGAAATFTDKIRAVIYPNSRTVSPKQEEKQVAQNSATSNPSSAPTSPPAGNQEAIPSHLQDRDRRSTDEPVMLNRQMTTDRPAQQRSEIRGEPRQSPSARPALSETDRVVSAVMQPPPPPPSGQESSLAQLSRMVREQETHAQNDVVRQADREALPIEEQQARPARDTASQHLSGDDSPSLGTVPLRPSPIQDIPVEQRSESRHAMSEQTGKREAAVQPAKRSDRFASGNAVPSSPSPMPVVPQTNVPQTFSPASSSTTIQPRPLSVPRLESMEASKSASLPDETSEDEREAGTSRTAMESTQPTVQAVGRRRLEGGAHAAFDDTLLNIVQSLPPMSSPAPQPPVLSGRATRSLGSVLLEGHLVPQERLEVAQHIQRMLRGVDMNYQLGEILLMFKLLTPDQLLAASLVSYGLISTAQISALGRIRQELHSIGLDYDLESLLVLFRILTPEQLREVRSSWSA